MEELVEKAKSGDKEASTKLVKNIYNQLYGIAFLKLKNEMDAQDVVQDTLILIYNNIKQLRDNKKFKSWAIRILINECNKKFNYQFKNIEDIDNYRDICSSQNLEEIINKLDTIDMFKGLKKIDRDIMILHYYNYRSEEIAEILNMKENTIKTKIRRIKAKLNKNYKLDKEKGVIVEINKLRKTLISIILALLVTTGIVYATITIVKILDREEKPQPIKWSSCNARINLLQDSMGKYMEKYDENMYILLIKDLPTFNEIKEHLNLEVIGEEINSELFDKYQYDILLVTFEQQKRMRVQNLLPYEDKIEITFNIEQKSSEEEHQNTFCIFIPKAYSDRKIELIYEDYNSNTDKSENYTTFKFSECYIKNTQEFNNINLQYDEKQDIYYSELLNIDEYNKLSNQLDIVIERPALNGDLSKYNIILVFKKTSNKLTYGNYRIEDDKTKITIRELQQEYGDGINGVIFCIALGIHTDFSILLK